MLAGTKAFITCTSPSELVVVTASVCSGITVVIVLAKVVVIDDLKVLGTEF